MKVYQRLAQLTDARLRCIESHNGEWEYKHQDSIDTIIDNLPHGSGIDGKTSFDYEYSNANRLKITSEYHAMNENGFYDGWYSFSIIIKPSLMFGCDIKISGNFGKYSDVKDYLYQTFEYALNQEVLPDLNLTNKKNGG